MFCAKLAKEHSGGDGRSTFGNVLGVRGSVAYLGPMITIYGENTFCQEARAADNLSIFDDCTGLKPLGGVVGKDGKPFDVDWSFTPSPISIASRAFRSSRRFTTSGITSGYGPVIWRPK